MTGKKTEYPCIICKQHVKKNDKSVQCSLCQLWVHITCEVIAEETFKVLCNAAKNGGGVFWSCRSCTAYSIKFNSSIQEINRKLIDIEQKLVTNTADVDSVKGDVKSIKDDLTKVKSQIDKNVDNSSAKIFSEIRDRESRKMNLIFHNLTEPSANNKEDRISEDQDILKELCGEINVDIDTSKVKFMSRLGKYTEGGTRPLLVGLRDGKVKESILNNAPRLASKPEPWCDINIIPDLTKQQRAEEQSLVTEATERNSKLSDEDKKNFVWKVVGRRGERRIVKTSPIQETGQGPVRGGARGRARGRGRGRGRGGGASVSTWA